jgi:hypothetical protein
MIKMNKLAIARMNKLAIASFYVLLSGGLLNSTALAASQDATVTGEVDPILTLAVTGSSTFKIPPGGVTSETVASITINSNDAQGYDVTLLSANAGVLDNSADASATATNSINYTVDYDNGVDAAAFISLSGTATNVESVTSTTNGEASRTLNLKIAAADSAESQGNRAGLYTDVVTVELLGK